jgi:hypothetical protein
MRPCPDAQIALVLPSSGRQRVDGRSHSSLIRDYYVEIDDGLGVQAGDSGTADVRRDVLNASQCCVYLAAQSFELPRPLRVIRDNNGWNVHQAIFRDNGRPTRIITHMHKNVTLHAPHRTQLICLDRQPRGGSSGVGRNTLTDASVHRPISASQMISRSHPVRPVRGG